MAVNKKTMLIDFIVLLIVVIAIYYLRIQNGDIISPAEGVQAFIGVN